MITPTKFKENSFICPKCDNFGYYEVGITGKTDKLNMFCSCGRGRTLKKLSWEWRINDLSKVANEILPRLNVIKSSLHEPSKAGNYLDSLIKDIDELVKKSENALKTIKEKL